MRRLKTLTLVLIIIISMVALSGCGSNVLYGKWAHQYSADANGQNQYEPPFPLTYEIRRDGTVYVLEYKFGDFSKERSEYEFTYKSGDVDTGGYKIEGYTLTLYPDDVDQIHVFYKVDESATE